MPSLPQRFGLWWGFLRFTLTNELPAAQFPSGFQTLTGIMLPVCSVNAPRRPTVMFLLVLLQRGDSLF
jgi:hypothetical protein